MALESQTRLVGSKHRAVDGVNVPSVGCAVRGWDGGCGVGLSWRVLRDSGPLSHTHSDERSRATHSATWRPPLPAFYGTLGDLNGCGAADADPVSVTQLAAAIVAPAVEPAAVLRAHVWLRPAVTALQSVAPPKTSTGISL